MVTGIHSWQASLLSGVVSATRTEVTLGLTPEREREDPDRGKLSSQGNAVPVASSGEGGFETSHTVIYEPTSLLAHLSDAGFARKVAEPPPRGNPAGIYGAHSFLSLRATGEAREESVRYTFEITV